MSETDTATAGQVKASPASRKPKQQTQYRNYKPAEGTEEFVEAKQQRKTSKTALSALSLYGYIPSSRRRRIEVWVVYPGPVLMQP